MFSAFEFKECRTVFSDEAYAAIGRGLTFAIRFESNCRGLATLGGFKQQRAEAAVQGDSLEFDEWLASFVEEYWGNRRLRQHTQSIAFQYRLPLELRRVIKKGRTARNDLVHEIALGIEPEIESDTGRARILAQLQDLTMQIASADRVVALLVHVENDDPLPGHDRYDSYVGRAVAWVCDVEGGPE